jgi:hypothetical protein
MLLLRDVAWAHTSPLPRGLLVGDRDRAAPRCTARDRTEKIADGRPALARPAGLPIAASVRKRTWVPERASGHFRPASNACSVTPDQNPFGAQRRLFDALCAIKAAI